LKGGNLKAKIVKNKGSKYWDQFIGKICNVIEIEDDGKITINLVSEGAGYDFPITFDLDEVEIIKEVNYENTN